MNTRPSIRTMEFEDLSFKYDDGPAVFSKLSFVIPTNKAVWIRSPGARGKSTILKILTGLLRSQEGSYLINGEKVNEMSFEQFLPYRMNMGYGFDMGGLINNMTVAENLSLPLRYHKLVTPEEVEQRVQHVIDLFDMHQIRNQRPFAVSGSQRKLTCVVRSFMHWPQVVFLDDPMTGLKQDNLNELYRYVEESYAERGLKQLIFTSENPELARKFQAEELLISADWATARSAA